MKHDPGAVYVEMRCVVCGTVWKHRTGPYSGRPPRFCPRCRNLRRYIGQLEHLVVAEEFTPADGQAETRERVELHRRIVAVANRIPCGHWRRGGDLRRDGRGRFAPGKKGEVT